MERFKKNCYPRQQLLLNDNKQTLAFGKLLRNLPAFCFHSSATIKTCKRIYFS